MNLGVLSLSGGRPIHLLARMLKNQHFSERRQCVHVLPPIGVWETVGGRGPRLVVKTKETEKTVLSELKARGAENQKLALLRGFVVWAIRQDEAICVFLRSGCRDRDTTRLRPDSFAM